MTTKLTVTLKYPRPSHQGPEIIRNKSTEKDQKAFLPLKLDRSAGRTIKAALLEVNIEANVKQLRKFQQ